MIDTVKEARKAYDERMEAQGWITMGAFVDMMPIGFSRDTLKTMLQRCKVRRIKVMDYPEMHGWGKIFISKEDAEHFADRIWREREKRESGDYIPLWQAVAMFKGVATEEWIKVLLKKSAKGGRDLYLREDVERMAQAELKIWEDAGLKRSECVRISYITSKSGRKESQVRHLIKCGVWAFKGVKYHSLWYYLKTDVDRVLGHKTQTKTVRRWAE
jgi:hypothetical protein